MVTGMPLRVRLALWVGAGAAALLPCGASAHYPFPSGPEEKKKADQIKDAVQAKTQASVDALTKLNASVPRSRAPIVATRTQSCAS